MESQPLIESFKPILTLFGDQPILQAGIAIIITFIVAKVLQIIVSRGLHRLSLKTKNNLDERLINIIHRPLFWSILFVGLVVAIKLLDASENAVDYSQAIFATILIFMWSGFLLKASKMVLRTIAASSNPQKIVSTQTLPLFENLAIILLLGLAVYLLFSAWGVDMTAWLASAGIAGIAIGFAAKDTLANLFSGVFILADSPYKIGDYVVLDNGQRGAITHIGIRSTRLLTRDDVEVTIPNSIMGNTQVINESGGPHEKYRIRTMVSVSYDCDIDQVKALLYEISQQEPSVCKDPEPRVRFRSFGASGLDVELLCWVEKPELRGRVLDSLNTAIFKKFREENIEIPYAKQDLYIKQAPKGFDV